MDAPVTGDAITEMSAVEMARRIRERSLSCADLMDHHLERIDRLNPTINAFCTVLHDAAREAARRADTALAAGHIAGPLFGLPIALKDLTPTAGVRTTRGSRAFATDVPGTDALIVQRIREAGGIIVGKTNTPEFGHKCVTDNLLFGPTRNPWNPERVAGGSSGGSAAAVAAGMVPLAEGSDGAGSIRVPAAMCGVFGFKPGFGRVPTAAGAFSSHSPFLHNGPIARSVADAALLYQVMAGASADDPFSLPCEQDIIGRMRGDLRGMRIGWSMDLGYFPVEAQTRRVFMQALDAFRELGCEVEEVFPGFDPGLEEHFRVLWCTKLASATEGLSPEQHAMLEPCVQALIRRADTYRAIDCGRANLAREAVWNRMLAIHRRHDLLLCPTTSIASFRVDEDPPRAIDGIAVDPLLGWFLTYPFNLTGHPAASIPCGRTPEGMPVGMQIIGRRLDDALVLRAARCFESIRPWPRVASPEISRGANPGH